MDGGVGRLNISALTRFSEVFNMDGTFTCELDSYGWVLFIGSGVFEGVE